MRVALSKDRYAIERLINETCDPDEDMWENIEIILYDDSTYHIQYIVDDPCYCIDFKVKITKIPYNDERIYHFHVFDNVYADDGDFFLDYHLVPDNN